MRDFDLTTLIITISVFVVAIGIHEFCHAKFADLAGDPTPRLMGRVTLNPLAHLDPLGTLMIILSSVSGVGIGWGKPVMVNPEKMRNPRWDHFVSVAAGPISNLLLAVVFAVTLRLMFSVGLFDPAGDPPLIFKFLLIAILLNLGLFVFNLIPLGPLDGHWLVGAFLPDPARLHWYRFNRGIGGLLFIGLVLIPAGHPLDVLGRVMYPAIRFLFRLLMGGGL